MITGLTHNLTGEANDQTRIRGKISTGYAPKEAPNTKDMAVASGFFRILKPVMVNVMIGGKPTPMQKWVVDDVAQKLLIDANKGNTTPRRIEGIFMKRLPSQVWESFMGKFSKSDGLICKSQGKGSVAMEVVYDRNDKRSWKQRKFKDCDTCPYDECPDFKSGACKPTGLLKVHPLIMDRADPYQLSTHSINTILKIESALKQVYDLSAMAYMLKRGGLDENFMGLAGITYTLIHKKVKSGGRDVFITELECGETFGAYAMRAIKEGIQAQNERILSGANLAQISITGSVTNTPVLAEPSQPLLLENEDSGPASGIVLPETNDDGGEEVVESITNAEDIVNASTPATPAGTGLDAAAADLLNKTSQS